MENKGENVTQSLFFEVIIPILIEAYHFILNPQSEISNPLVGV